MVAALAMIMAFTKLCPVLGNPLKRPFPDTSYGLHVFPDYVGGAHPPGLSDPQMKFVASHFAGTQKIFRRDAARYRQLNPKFIVLHYRLSEELGFRRPDVSSARTAPAACSSPTHTSKKCCLVVWEICAPARRTIIHLLRRHLTSLAQLTLQTEPRVIGTQRRT